MLDLLPSTAPADLPSLLASLSAVAPLLDAMPGVVFFVKDAQARYVLVNQTLATRCGYRDKSELLGRTAEEVFPSRFGPLYTAQDKEVLEAGSLLADQLELHLYPGRQPGCSPCGRCCQRRRCHRLPGHRRGSSAVFHRRRDRGPAQIAGHVSRQRLAWNEKSTLRGAFCMGRWLQAAACGPLAYLVV